MSGSASFSFMSFFPSPRHPRTAESVLKSPRRRNVPSSSARRETNARLVAAVARADPPPHRAEHRTHVNGLWRGDGGTRIAHLRPGDEAALDCHFRPDPEE